MDGLPPEQILLSFICLFLQDPGQSKVRTGLPFVPRIRVRGIFNSLENLGLVSFLAYSAVYSEHTIVRLLIVQTVKFDF